MLSQNLQKFCFSSAQGSGLKFLLLVPFRALKTYGGKKGMQIYQHWEVLFPNLHTSLLCPCLLAISLLKRRCRNRIFRDLPPAQWHSCEFSKSWVLQGFCNPSIKNLTKSLFPLYWLQNQVGIYLKSSVHRLRKESFANAGRERQKCRFLLRQPCVLGVWDPENRNYTTKTIQLARLGCYSSERLWSGECV